MQRCARLCRTAGAGCAAAASPAASSTSRAQEYARAMVLLLEQGTCGTSPLRSMHGFVHTKTLVKLVYDMNSGRYRSRTSRRGCSQALFASRSTRLVSLVAVDLTAPFNRYTGHQVTAERAARFVKQDWPCK